ncbi:MAG: DNA polymerase III subunit delta' [Pseudomonadota bacterium]
MPEYSIPYPWQQNTWQAFLRRYEQGRIPHAALLSGQQGMGKRHLANTMANLLLCQQPKSGLPCGTCRACVLIQSESHPDKIHISPEEGARQIKIDQIRSLSAFVGETAQQGGNKVVVLGPLEALNINAANALLKNLEEPTPGTYFMVFSHILSAAMATIRSRCQIVPLGVPTREQSIQWLSLANTDKHKDLALYLDFAAGAPLLAKRLLSDENENLKVFIKTLVTISKTIGVDLSIIQNWLDIDLSDLLNWWLHLIYLWIMIQTRKNQDYDKVGTIGRQVYDLADLNYNKQWLFRFSDKLMALKRQVLQGANHNRQLLLEELLLDWCAIMKAATTHP